MEWKMLLLWQVQLENSQPVSSLVMMWCFVSGKGSLKKKDMKQQLRKVCGPIQATEEAGGRDAVKRERQEDWWFQRQAGEKGYNTGCQRKHLFWWSLRILCIFLGFLDFEPLCQSRGSSKGLFSQVSGADWSLYTSGLTPHGSGLIRGNVQTVFIVS